MQAGMTAGGAFTRLSIALHVAVKGLLVRMPEVEPIGTGGSGRNVGLVNAALGLPPVNVLKKLGKTIGPRFGNAQRVARGAGMAISKGARVTKLLGSKAACPSIPRPV